MRIFRNIRGILGIRFVSGGRTFQRAQRCIFAPLSKCNSRKAPYTTAGLTSTQQSFRVSNQLNIIAYEQRGKDVRTNRGVLMDLTSSNANNLTWPEIYQKIARELADKTDVRTSMSADPIFSEFSKLLTSQMPYPPPSGRNWNCQFSQGGTSMINAAIHFAMVTKGKSKVVCLRNAWHGSAAVAGGATCPTVLSERLPHLDACFVHIDQNEEGLNDLRKVLDEGDVAMLMFEAPAIGIGGAKRLNDSFVDEAVRMARESGVFVAYDINQVIFRMPEADGIYGIKQLPPPDIVCGGKAISGPYGLGFMFMDEEAETREIYGFDSSVSPHTITFCYKLFEYLLEQNLDKKCTALEKSMNQSFQTMISRLPMNPFYETCLEGVGLFQGLTVRGETDEEKLKNANALHMKCLNNGIYVTLSGQHKNVLRLQPAPDCWESEDIIELFRRMQAAIEQRHFI